MRHFRAIFAKQLVETFRNKTILIQFVMFPVLTIIMENTVNIEGMPEHYFTNLFAIMYIGMAPLTCMATVLSEEREKNTLRVLLMSNVKPTSYLMGVGFYTWAVCMIGSVVMGIGGGYRDELLMKFLLIMALGITVSVLIGAAVGTWCKTQMAATSVTVPIMMVFSFLPMLSMFNSGIEKVAVVTYSQQLNRLLTTLTYPEATAGNFWIILANALLAGIAFVIAYKRSGLE